MKNMQQLFKQAQQMQEKMKSMQAKLAEEYEEGSSGAGLVKLTLDGQGHIKALSIDPSLLAPDEKDMVEDLIIAAYNDAKTKLDKKTAEAMSSLTGGLNIPGLKW